MKRAAVAIVVLLGATSALAQRPSNPALLIPHVAPELDYVSVPDPLTFPAGTTMGPSASAAFDSRGHLFVLNRGPQPLMEFDADGKFIRGFGEGLFTRSHGMRIDSEDNIWATDVEGHVVYKFSPQGQVLLTLGTKGQVGVVNEPTDVAIGRNGEVFVSDGHLPGTEGDARILKFDRTGKFIKSWGSKGKGPGQFEVPHGIAVDAKNQIWVTDREGQRIEIFDAEGTFIKELKYAGLPSGVYIGDDYVYMVNGFAGQILRLDLNGNVLSATGKPGKGLGEFGEAHYIAVSPKGELYVTDPTNRILQKFVKK